MSFKELKSAMDHANVALQRRIDEIRSKIKDEIRECKPTYPDGKPRPVSLRRFYIDRYSLPVDFESMLLGQIKNYNTDVTLKESGVQELKDLENIFKEAIKKYDENYESLYIEFKLSKKDMKQMRDKYIKYLCQNALNSGRGWSQSSDSDLDDLELRFINECCELDLRLKN